MLIYGKRKLNHKNGEFVFDSSNFVADSQSKLGEAKEIGGSPKAAKKLYFKT
jgi:hypothetical protein